jgi:DNA-directed RNA polymerase specialized sigma24 family protein
MKRIRTRDGPLDEPARSADNHRNPMRGEISMADSRTTHDLIRGLRDRCSWAFRLMNSVYTPRLVAMARARLRPQLREKLDAEDVVQSVYCSLLRGGYLVPNDEDELWRLLRHRTRRKVARKVRWFRRKKRDAAREVLPDGGASSDSDGSGPAEPMDYRFPAPDDAAMVAEATSQLLGALTGTERTIIERCLRHQTIAEIARDLQCSTRTVERARARACQILQSAIQSKEA